MLGCIYGGVSFLEKAKEDLQTGTLLEGMTGLEPVVISEETSR